MDWYERQIEFNARLVESNAALVSFLEQELDFVEILIERALTTNSADRRRKALDAARKALETVRKFQGRVAAEDRESIQRHADDLEEVISTL